MRRLETTFRNHRITTCFLIEVVDQKALEFALFFSSATSRDNEVIDFSLMNRMYSTRFWSLFRVGCEIFSSLSLLAKIFLQGTAFLAFASALQKLSRLSPSPNAQHSMWFSGNLFNKENFPFLLHTVAEYTVKLACIIL